jgi:transposase
MAYLRDMANLLEDWPSGSPDLNPIESLWAILKRRVEELGPRTKDELIEVIVTAWESIDVLCEPYSGFDAAAAG